MAREKFNAMQCQYTLAKLASAERWARGEETINLYNEEACAKQVLIELFDGKNVFSPLEKNMDNDAFMKKLEHAFEALFRLYKGERKGVICLDYGKCNSSALDEWLVNTLPSWFGIKQNIEDEMPRISQCSNTLPPRTNAEIVEVMLTLLERGIIRQFGSVSLCDDSEEFPPKRIKY